MAVTTITIPTLAKITITPKTKAMDRIATVAAAVTREAGRAVIIMVGAMDMEIVEVAVEDTIVTRAVATVEAKEVAAEAVDTAIAAIMEIALAVVTRGYGDRNSGGGDGMVTQEDTIFVSGMDPSISEEEICQHFGAIGVIKHDKRTGKPKIWMYKDKNTGKSKGEATVTYDDQNAARSAISWFDGKEFKGCTIKVQIAQHKSNWQGNRMGGGRGGGGGGGRGRGGFGGRGGGGDRDDHHRGGGDDRRDSGSRGGDWRCPNLDCGNTNFAWRDQCNLCKSSKPEGLGYGGGGGGSGGGGGGSGGGRGGGGRGGGGDRGSRGGYRGDRGGRGGDRGGRGGGGGGGGFRGDRGGRGGRGGPMRGGGGRGDRDRDRQRPY
ncbi:RNA-binding protein cabeza isoform X2 [Ooceraea biroi]|uniref:RNA-binding protein cabeza isoform X2 n=1 Tax=Ooceraea biroi TaxID=2015173 RepID=UPI0005BD6D41|nr:RNA-binding protein cabeza isoform X2 [Ooceraea biroi]